MGREVVFANIRKRMIAMIVGGVILTLMGGFISFAAVVASEYSVLILGLFALTPGVIFLIFGTSRRTHPEKSGIFKANPDLLQQADELYANIQYQDDYIIVSDRVLANKKVPFQMCWREEAYGIYQHTASMNFISYTNEIIVCTQYILLVLRAGEIKNILFAATGALMSPTVNQQGESIPSISHLVWLSGEKDMKGAI